MYKFTIEVQKEFNGEWVPFWNTNTKYNETNVSQLIQEFSHIEGAIFESIHNWRQVPYYELVRTRLSMYK